MSGKHTVDVPKGESDKNPNLDKKDTHPNPISFLNPFKPFQKDAAKRQDAIETFKKNQKEEKELKDSETARLEAELHKEFTGDFIGRAKTFKEEFKDVDVEVAGEKHTLSFSSFTKDGKNVKNEEVDHLIEDVQKGKVDINRLSGNFQLVSTNDKEARVNLNFNVPVLKMLTFQNKATLTRFVTETFAGTDGYYKKMRASAEAQGKKEIPPAQHAAHEENVQNIRQVAESKKATASILSSESMTSVVVRFSTERQIHFTSVDRTLWHVAEVSNGKITSEQTTDNPREVIEKEPSGGE
jgi:hypothetical protein